MRIATLLSVLVATAGCWIYGCQLAGAGRTVSQGTSPALGDVGAGSTVRIITIDLTGGQATGLLGAGGLVGAGLAAVTQWLITRGKKPKPAAPPATPTP